MNGRMTSAGSEKKGVMQGLTVAETSPSEGDGSIELKDAKVKIERDRGRRGETSSAFSGLSRGVKSPLCRENYLGLKTRKKKYSE